MLHFKIPKEVIKIVELLKKAGFKAYIVGGCVRDLLLKTTPKDWDVATNAKPKEIQEIFPNSFYKNKFVLMRYNHSPSDRISSLFLSSFTS